MSTPLHVLLVEDELVDAMTVKRAAQKRGLPVDISVVESAEDALVWLLASSGDTRDASPRPPDLIMADLRLPQLSGLDLMERVKQDTRLRRVPFVMLSTSSHDCEVSRAYELGAAGYFVKPLAFEDYADIVERVVQFCLCAERPSATSGPREPEPRPGQ